MFEPLLSPLFSSLFSSLIDPAQRIFITADPVLETHFPLENTKTLTGDFRVGALCVLPTAATTVTLHGQLASVSNYFKVLSTGFASISIGGSVVTSTVLATKDSELRNYDVELSGNDFLFQEDGVTIDTVTDAGAAANSLVIDVLCQSNGADFFDGIYADPKITDITTPSNSESWAINRPFPATTEQSSSGNNILTYVNAPDSTRGLFTFNQSDNEWVGVELWLDMRDPKWTPQGAGTSTPTGATSLTATIGGSGLKLSNAVIVGGTYKIIISNLTNAQVWIGVSGATAQKLTSNGAFIITPESGNTALFLRATTAGTASADVSVKRIIQIA